jgi:S-adenosyl-L-methionine-dependent methyltransferase
MADAYELVQLKNGTWSVRSTAEGETFHPVVGPEAEAEALYVRGLRVADRMAAHQDGPWVIWDVGLGAAANILTVLRSLPANGRPVRVLSFDHTLEPLRFALEHRTALRYVEGHESLIEGLLSRGRVVRDAGPFPLDWEVLQADFPTLLEGTGAMSWPQPHVILFDAFSPARNPAMWTLPVFQRLRELAPASTPCAMATYSRATLLRVTLLLAGWHVGVGHATGEKEETTLAANVPELIGEPLGSVWLDRARRSTSAEPLRGPRYRQEPLSETSWSALLAHPQFRSPTADPGRPDPS